MEKEIEKAKSNEALEDLEVINNYGCGINDNLKFSEVFEKEYTTIKQALTTKSKKEQAFDIANKKCVDMYRLAVADNVASYNKWTEFDEYWLTEEEYDLLKEVLNDNSQE